MEAEVEPEFDAKQVEEWAGDVGEIYLFVRQGIFVPRCIPLFRHGIR